MKIYKVEHFYKELASDLVVCWRMTDVCNYSCSYCPESLRNGKEYKIDISAIDNFLSQLMYQNKNRKVFFHLGGGEPTILKNFEELLQLFKTYGINVSIQTNGSRPLSWWKKNIHYFSKVHLSYHSLECSNEEFFFEKVKHCSNIIPTHVNVMAIPGKLKELVPFASRVSKETKATVSLDALYEDFENDIFNYSADDLKLLSTVYTQDYDLRNYNTEYNRRGFMKIAEDESSEMHLCAAEILKKELNNFKGWSCEAGRENLVILEDSKVYRCYGKVGGPIGSIIDKEFKLPNSPVICSREKCFSGFDIQCTKIVQSAN